MDYQYISPVPRVHRVIIDGQLQTYQNDLWVWEGRDTVLAPKVKDWLDQKGIKVRVTCDRGDWGEGTPIFYIDFPNKAAADQFMQEFGRFDEVSLELRTCKLRSGPFYPDLIQDSDGKRIPNFAVLSILEQMKVDPVEMTVNADGDGEYIAVVFETPEQCETFGMRLWQAFRKAQTKENV